MIWNDKRPVSMITTCYDTREFIIKNDKSIPKCIDAYNKYMGGVDKFDQMIKYYPLKRKTNRWPNRFTMHIMQILLHNSYVLYKEFFIGQKLDHFDFHCSFIDYLLKDSMPIHNEMINHSSAPHYLIKEVKRSNCVYCWNNGI